MSGILPGDAPHHRMVEHSPSRFSYGKSDEHICVGSSWYFNQKEIEENSPSRKDGIDLKKESYFRKSYCTFLQDLGMRLKVPQVMIATAIVFCHRFFLCQSHAKNDRRTIATVCMFLAGKVEETPRPLKDVILVSYEIIHKKDPAAVQRIKQKEVYEQQKELVLLGERLVLATLGFDLNVHHPYKPLVEAIKKFKVAQNALAQVAWNFVNDGLRTSLCLQFKPHHIAAGAIFLAAKFLKVKLPSDGEKVWWQEFDVTPRQLEEVSNQMLELYEQNRATPSSHGNEAEGGTASMTIHQAPAKALPAIEQSPTQYSQAAGTTSVQHGIPTNPLTSQLQAGPGKAAQTGSDDHGEKEPRSIPCDHKTEGKFKDRLHSESGNNGETSDSRFSYGSEHPSKEPIVPHMVGNGGTMDMNPVQSEVPKSYTPMDAMKKIDKDKVKAALEKRRRSRSDVPKKIDFIDEDDLIERELEHGVELAVEDERERRHSWSRPFNRQEPQNLDHGTKNGIQGTEKDTENAEEGEVNAREFRSPDPGSHKRKAASPSKQVGLKEYCDFPHNNGPSLKH